MNKKYMNETRPHLSQRFVFGLELSRSTNLVSIFNFLKFMDLLDIKFQKYVRHRVKFESMFITFEM